MSRSKKPTPSKRVSLHPLTPEQAIGKMFGDQKPKKAAKKKAGKK